MPGSGLRRSPQRPPVAVGPDQYQQQWNQRGHGHRPRRAGYGAQPIVQDGWQWDPVGQQWHPVGQTPEQWRAQQAAQEQQAAAAPPAEADEDPGEQTQIRPPQ